MQMPLHIGFRCQCIHMWDHDSNYLDGSFSLSVSLRMVGSRIAHFAIGCWNMPVQKSDMNLALRSEIHWSFSKPATSDCPCNDVCIISEALEHHANVLSLFFPGEGGGIHE